ncbi:glycosyltransferase family 2 protein [Butyrivibrio sp. CB08]|uniref:glycosyltransferase family 2 protein n=1 Tax=Butyrivibrio sp. CB08 TaxID=2364879 RepID=UPI000EA97059|nr:glycosyltransferase family 2 protein [Butyrivibrio sp. CB08]RKM59795.1 glycosyltransferase family 2 protein [Butyrivibrio sp. CB08]
MLFSIIIPVCNGEDVLTESVSSALSQSESYDGGDFEILIVENGSRDKTPEIADGLSQKHENIRCIHRGRIGLFAARQEGILEAKGDYIVSLDADDKLAPFALKELASSITELKQKGCDVDMLIYRARELTDDGQGEMLHKKLLEDGRVYEGEGMEELYRIFAYGDSLNSMWTKCVKRSIAAVGHEGIFINNGEDLYQTAVYLDRAGEVFYMDKALYLYRRAGESMTSSYNASYLAEEKQVWTQMDEFLGKRNNPQYDKWVEERKSLTCSIQAGSIVYSGIGLKEKGRALDQLFEDEFYKKYGTGKLPEWAPEQPMAIHDMLVSADAKKLLMATARKHDFKVTIKKIRNNIFGN